MFSCHCADDSDDSLLAPSSLDQIHKVSMGQRLAKDFWAIKCLICRVYPARNYIRYVVETGAVEVIGISQLPLLIP